MTSQWEAQVVGINYYSDYTTLQPLTAAAKDAEAIATQLEEYGYQTFRVQRLPRKESQKGEWQINPDEGVNSRELREGIVNLFNPPDDNPPETALLFFSGHGWRKLIDEKDEVFLATSDVYPTESNYGIAVSWLGKLIQESPVKKLIIWLDCCYSGELVKYLPEDKDYCILTATRSYEPGIEIKHQEGLFTQALREGLNPNNYPDGLVDSHKLAKFIQERMAQTGQAPQCFNSQRSILLTSKFAPKAFRDECPYRSLSYFTEEQKDAQVFYGRTKLTQELVKRVREKERLIAVFGASGSGKSSLLRAGLLYQLKLGQEIVGSNNWVYLEPFTPTDDPLARLEQILSETNLSLKAGDLPLKADNLPLRADNLPLKADDLPLKADDLPLRAGDLPLRADDLPLRADDLPLRADDLPLRANNLPLRANDLPLKVGSNSKRDARTPKKTRTTEEKIEDSPKRDEITPIILIIDQFEECFTMCDEETRKEFIIDRLTKLLKTTPNLQLIIGMRSDFRGRLREFPEFAQKMSKVNVEHLNREEIQEAIEKPAEFVGLGIEGSLKQQLINDVEDYPGSLPLLQYTLTELWNEARNQGEQFLRLETYTTLGGIEGTLEKRADAVYKNLPEAEQTVAKRLFLELTQVGETLDTRRRVMLGDLVNSHHSLEILDRVTEKLANQENRLITRTEAEKAEDTDESQIRSPLTPLQKGGTAKILIDVVHEALIRNWKRLGDWKQQYQAAMVIERRIEAAAQDWEKGGRKNEDLLRESRLATAEGYLKSFSDLGMLDGMAEEFINESRKRKQVVRRNWIFWGTAVSLSLLAASAISVWFGLDSQKQKAIALSEQKKAYKQELIAKKAAKRADDNAKKADDNAKKAEAQARQAKINADKAEVQARLAAKNEKKANANALETKKQAEIARQNFLEARKQAEIAKKRSQEAEQEKLRAENAAREAQEQTKIATEKTVLANKRQIDAEIGQIEALVSSSNALFKTDETFDSLLAAVQASSKFQRFATLKLNNLEQSKKELFKKVYYVLQQSVHGIREITLQHENPVFGVVFSPNGEMIATKDSEGVVRLWTKTGKLLKTLPKFIPEELGHYMPHAMNLSFSYDNNMLAVAGIDKVIRVWNIKTNSLREFKGHSNFVLSVNFSQNNNNLVSVSTKIENNPSIGEVILWNMENGQILKTFRPFAREHFTASFHPNGKLIAVGGTDEAPQGKVKLVDIQGNLVKEFEQNTGGRWGIQISKDGEKIITEGTDEPGHPKLWLLDIVSGKTIQSIDTNPDLWLMGIKMSSDGKIMASIDQGGGVKIWDLQGKLVTTLHSHNNMVQGLDFSPDGKTLATSSSDKTVQLHKLENDFSKSIEEEKNNGIAFSPKGDVFASSSWNPATQEWVIKLWTKDGKFLKKFPDDNVQDKSHHYGDIIKDIHFSSDGQLIGTASWDGSVKIWSLEGKLLHNFTGYGGAVNGLAFSPNPNSQQVALGGYSWENGSAFWMLWDLKSGKARKIFGHSTQIYRLAFSPDGKIVATASWDRTIKLWNAMDGKLIRTLNGKHDSFIFGLSFSPDSKMLASSGQDKTVRLWSVDGKLLHILVDHQGDSNDVVFSPDGKIIASASSDQTIKLWNTDGILLRTLRGHNGELSGLSFSPDGKTLVSGSWGDGIKIWRIETLDFDGLLKRGCSWLPDYLKTTLNEQNPTQQICSKEP